VKAAAIGLVAVLACLSRVHVTVAMGSASLSMTGLAWVFALSAAAVAVAAVLVIRKAAAEGFWIAPLRRSG
jgi:hypothetical protein